jgi:hypothetical protein
MVGANDSARGDEHAAEYPTLGHLRAKVATDRNHNISFYMSTARLMLHYLFTYNSELPVEMIDASLGANYLIHDTPGSTPVAL